MYGRTGIQRISTVASAAVLLAFALAGCGGGGGGTPGIGGSTTGTLVGGATGGGGTTGSVVGGATSSGSSSGGTTGTATGGTTGGSSTYTATAVVTVGGVAKPGVTVILSSGVAATTPNAPSVIATQVTNDQGVAVFPGLTKGTNYCFTASFTDNTGSHQVVSCSNRGDTTVLLQF